LRWKKGLIFLLAFFGFSILITVFPFAFVFDLASNVAEAPVQSPRWSDFLVRLSLLTIGGVAAMAFAISLLEKIIGRENYG
jgi:hypothetical protein